MKYGVPNGTDTKMLFVLILPPYFLEDNYEFYLMAQKQKTTSESSTLKTSTRQLFDKHYREWVEGRELSRAWVEANIRSVSRAEAESLLGYPAKSSGAWIEGANHQGQFRPDKPWRTAGDLQVEKRKKAPKYRTPEGTEYDAILVNHPTDPQYWENIEALKEQCYKINGHPCLLITEGVAKAIACCSNSLPTIALLGVEMGLTSSKADVQSKRYLVPSLEKYARVGFGFIFAFDADAATNPNVNWAQLKLAHQIKKFNVPQYSITGLWSIEQGKGMDDYIQNNGADKFRREVLAKAEIIEKWEQQFKNTQEKSNKKTDKPPSPKALADMLYDSFREKWAYDLSQGVWRIWNQVIWEKRHDKAVQKLLKTQAQSMGIEYKKETYIKDTMESLSLLLLKEKWESFDRSAWIAGTNGVLNITTGKVEPHKPGFGFTSVLPHEVRSFQPSKTEAEILAKLQADCPETHQFFNVSMLGDSRRVLKLLAIVAGILRFRLSKLQKYIHLIGEPGTGKGTFMRLLKDVVGSKNCQSASLSKLHDGSVMARIIDSQLALFPDERKQVGVEWLLKLTGEDDIDFRAVYTQGGSKPFYGSVVVASNNTVFTGDTTGIDRRLSLTVFQNIIPEDQRDADLQERLTAEVPSLVSVALSMPLHLVDDLICGRGIGKMPDIRWHEWQMKTEVDKVATFVSEMLIQDEWGTESASYLFQAYQDWAKESNHSKPGSNTFFGTRLAKHLNWLKWNWSKSKINGKNFYKGFRLRAEGDPNPTVDELLKPRDSFGTVPVGAGDGSGTVQNPDGARDRDSRDSCHSNNNAEHQNISHRNMADEPETLKSPSPETLKSSSPETVPTISKSSPKRDSEVCNTIPKEKSKLSLKESEPDYSSYPHLTWDSLEAKRNQALKIKQQLLEADSKEELMVIKGEWSARLTWVWRNLLTKAEKGRITAIAKTEQLNLFSSSPASPEQKEVAQQEGEELLSSPPTPNHTGYNFKVGDYVLTPKGQGQIFYYDTNLNLWAVSFEYETDNFSPDELSPLEANLQ